MDGQISIVRPGACDDREIRMIIRLAMGKTITALITPENLALALPDYCNDPSASWPIIEKHRISILDQLTEWCVDAKDVRPIFDTRPLRAAMIVFLMMQENQNG